MRSAAPRLWFVLLILIAPRAHFAAAPEDPRSNALAGALDPSSVGAAAMTLNPAGLGLAPEDQAGLRGALDAQGHLGLLGFAALRPTRRMGLGLHAHWVDRGFATVYDSAGVRRGGIAQRDYGLGIALAVAEGNKVQAGLGLRMDFAQGLSDSASADADLGVSLGGARSWRGGLAVRGLRALAAQSADAELSWGAQGPWELLRPAFSFTWQPQRQPKVHAGAELSLPAGLALRGGFEHRFVETYQGDDAGLSLGLGWRREGLGADYAWRSIQNQNARHGISFWAALPGIPWGQRRFPPPPRRAVEALNAAGLEPQTSLTVMGDPLKEARDLELAGRPAEALAEYERVAGQQPDLAGAWRGAADLAYQLKDKERAMAHYQRLLLLEPDPELAAWIKAFQEEPEAP